MKTLVGRCSERILGNEQTNERRRQTFEGPYREHNLQTFTKPTTTLNDSPLRARCNNVLLPCASRRLVIIIESGLVMFKLKYIRWIQKQDFK